MTLLPEAKPKRSAKQTRRPIFEKDEEVKAAGSQRTIVVVIHRATMRIIVLNLPILSANRPGNHRPKKEPAFMIVISWYDNVDRMPFAKAKETR